MSKSFIEWTGSTWNPIRARNLERGQVGTWCQKISPGCANCYAARHNARNLPNGSSGLPYTAQGGERARIFLDPKILAEPLRRRKPETYFVCSMTDLFQAAHSFELIAAVWGIMAACPQHTFQVLTKRSERAREFLCSWVPADCGVEMLGRIGSVHLGRDICDLSDGRPWPLPNVWLGTSCETQEYADKRTPELLPCPAAVRFVSLEPLLGPIDLGLEVHELKEDGTDCRMFCTPRFVEKLEGGRLDWVIVGGESGHGARPMHPDWVRSLRDQCVGAEVPFFFKQWGEWAPTPRIDPHVKTSREFTWGDGNRVIRIGKHLSGRHLDGRTWDEMPEVTR